MVTWSTKSYDWPYLSGYLVMRVCHKTTSSLIPDPYNDYYRWGFHDIQFVINPQCTCTTGRTIVVPVVYCYMMIIQICVISILLVTVLNMILYYALSVITPAGYQPSLLGFRSLRKITV